MNTYKRNTIHISIQTQKIKLKEEVPSSLEVLKFAEEKFKLKNEICWTKVQKTMLFKASNNYIWHVNDFCDCLTLNVLLLSFTICNTLNNKRKRKNLKQEKISFKRKGIFKKLPLLFFSVSVNVYKQKRLQLLWKMLQPFKTLRETSIN